MADHAALTAQARTVAGKEVKKLRREGQVPGVVYGPAVAEPRAVVVDERTFTDVYQRIGSTALVDLAVDDAKHTVFIRNVQYHPIRRSVLHAEFYAPNMNQLMNAMVSVMTVGEIPASVDGILEHGRTEIEVRAMPEAIPQHFEVDLAQLADIESVIHVSDLAVPPGVEILTAPDEMLVRLAPPTMPAPEEVEPEVEEALDAATGDVPSALNEGVEPIEE